MIEQQTLLTPGTDDELNWLAFQYVTEQLPENQREAFETVLADDLAACEAVAAMSELAIQLKQVSRRELSQPEKTPLGLSTRLGSWVAVGSTLVALGWIFMLLNTDNSETSPRIAVSEAVTDSEEAAGLIAGWTGDEEETVLIEENLLDVETLDLNDSSTPDIPGWMIAAVSLENTEEKIREIMDEPIETKEN
ncbi:MAG: hypothetical protein P8M30_00560 [Planctomycetaceae bacterium]|jgi:hypothetical protein|nr:hypothetical protein [bacterium]MDB4679690.1 hypothetical protein [Planctomycetaceae bacterium]MDG2387784.1 hypothetical protein [Planctomycetaceae bacterium]